MVTTPADNIQDLDSEITRSAPFYSDLREKHVAVKGLGKGDILEYAVHWNPTNPLVAGQFWFAYNFAHDAIVLDERLEIKVPDSRVVKEKGPPDTQKVTAQNGFRIYNWTYSRLEDSKEAESDKYKIDAALGRLPVPDVQISSFQSLGKYHHRPPGGENYPDVTLRLHSFLGTLTRETGGESVLVVCHSVVVLVFRKLIERLLEQQVLEIDSDKNQEIRNCSVTHYACDPRAGKQGKLILQDFNRVYY